MHIDIGSVGLTHTDFSLQAAYVAMHLARGDGSIMAALHYALRTRALDNKRHDFIEQARSGMPDAILPFHRPETDVLYAAAIRGSPGSLGLRGLGNKVDAGCFVLDRAEVRYVDTVGSHRPFYQEVLDPASTHGLIDRLAQWKRRPEVCVGDFESGEMLRVYPGLDGLAALATAQLDPRLRDRYERATLTIFRVSQGESMHCCNSALRVEKLSQGTEPMVAEGDALVLRNPRPELVMEMHAASIDESVAGSLFLHVARGRDQMLAPLPDLMTTGATAQGWWMPRSDLRSALGGTDEDFVRVPRSVVLRLMERFAWVGVQNPAEWAMCAWSLHA